MALQSGSRVTLIDKNSFLGGNSTKATSGMNAAGTSVQRAQGIPDTPEIFEQDTTKSAGEGARPDLIKVLTHDSGPAVEWLMDKFGLELNVLGLMGGQSHPRTHRGKERFPGMMITYALMEKLEEISEQTPDKARVITKARATELLTENGEVVGVKYTKGGKEFSEYGVVTICTGGFGADFEDNSLLASVEDEWRTLKIWETLNLEDCMPPLRSLPTTNGEHCTGDGLKMALDLGANTVDLEAVQVHPTGLVDPAEPEAKVKFLAAEALRGAGGILLDKDGNRFANDLGKRDYVSGRIWKHNNGPYRLVLNSKAAATIDWHCKHYEGRGLMKKYNSGEELAKDMGIPASQLASSFATYNKAAEAKSDPFEKVIFPNTPVLMNEEFYVAFITPVVHYCMGGIEGNSKGEVVKADGSPIPGLFCGGEVMGGVHGKNRLGGSSLLDCVVYGRVSGASASKYLLEKLSAGTAGTLTAPGAGVNPNGFGVTVDQGPVKTVVSVDPNSSSMTLKISWGDSAGSSMTMGVTPTDGEKFKASVPQDIYTEGGDEAAPQVEKADMTAEEVAAHNTEKDCYVILHGKVYDVTEFLPDHPGGKKAIMLFAGKDASTEFDMLHKPEIITKYASEYEVGDLKAKL